VQRTIDEKNSELQSYAKIKKFLVLPEDFTVENGALTPTLKVNAQGDQRPAPRGPRFFVRVGWPSRLSRLDGKAASSRARSRGLGRAMALALAEAGADVALAARAEAELAETAARGRTAWPQSLDLAHRRDGL